MKTHSFILSFLALFVIGIAISIAVYFVLSTRSTPTVNTKANSTSANILNQTQLLLQQDAAKNVALLSPYQQLKLNELVALLPYATGSALISYSSRLNKVVATTPNVYDSKEVFDFLKKHNVFDIYEMEGSDIIILRNASSLEQAENDEIKLIKSRVNTKSSPSSVKGIATVNAQTQPPSQEIDPEEPYLPDQTDLVHAVEFVQNLMSVGDSDQELESTPGEIGSNDDHDDEGEQDENGPLVYSPDTSAIPCEAGKDEGSADGYRRGVKVKIKVCNVQGIRVNSQISGEVNRLLNDARADSFEMAKGSGGFRTLADQIRLRNAHGCPNPDTPSSSCRPPTARPKWSNHQMGLAIDFVCNGSLIQSKSGSCFNWLANNAGKYGLQNFPKEAWHWSVDGK